MSPDAKSRVSSETPVVDRLIDAAGEIFAEKGPSATVREICSAAGCSVAAINYYFGDKQRLYVRCVQAACELKQRLFPLPDIDPHQGGPEMLRHFLRAVASRMAAKSNLSWHNTLMLKEVISPSEGVAEMLQTPFARDFGILTQMMGHLLDAGLNSGACREALALQVVSRIMFLRTGANFRKIVGIQSTTFDDPLKYADHVCDSVLSQIDTLRREQHLPPLVWAPARPDPTSANQTR